jgi:hypothetical protein
MVIHKHLRTTQVFGGKKREIPIVYALAKIMETVYINYFSFFSVTVGLKEWCMHCLLMCSILTSSKGTFRLASDLYGSLPLAQWV